MIVVTSEDFIDRFDSVCNRFVRITFESLSQFHHSFCISIHETTVPGIHQGLGISLDDRLCGFDGSIDFIVKK